MSSRPRQRSSSTLELISCEEPPVGEVALTLQFAGEAVDLDVLAAFSAAVRSDLPNREQQPPAPHIRETFDAPQPQPHFEISLEPSSALPRTWFISTDATRLVQLQGDRISLNWRRPGDTAKYPGYKKLRRDLRRYFGTLLKCMEQAGRRVPALDLAEVTYVNPIEAPGPVRGGGHPELARILNRLRPRPRGAFLPPVEDAQVQTRWRIPGEEIGAVDRAAGRLYLAASPGLLAPGAPGSSHPAGVPIYVMTLTGRILPAGEGERAPWKALDTAHKWVVLGFKDLTTQEMHKQWGLEEKG